ncbi:dephospho-CoA kinase [Candidatus Methylopumilus universalis]|jgi:dephospho-CoA kinase|uniref:Dephospho-CoA kinase n=1 Tax=Candidatus Methylopumilus universalis TaxID=2588536 RepID=A0AAX1EY87_9PROT|nr:dephospho-CoA kinase [Candidatus Methylopumilus universalis]QDC40768.1 dephospho-CoA kinase [Candidatus Methylopumilus universalis]QDC42058.1 dephospho-CoA kinase [Candidatus Methylopumilus universalis]QDC54445.1 dephospho-CoA kinase [Candidatus Methylopumilus universalis]QDC55725.1 dephospho-CoA kinase [Candidatus Methylopumilus universalis]QDC57007.1 dephospho-CoA kinase [Candidatus Methylopumilus universalis]
MFIIGMTGGIGSGKSEALKIFKSLSIKVIDLDNISKEITETSHQAIQEIKLVFGDAIFDKDNQLDRKKLKEIIFSDKNKKINLEKILHPKIYEEVKKRLNALSHESYVVIDIPLLFETNQYTSLISRSLVIDCKENDQIERVKKRDGIDISVIQSIIDQQINRSSRIEKADDVVINDGSIENLEESIKSLHKKYLNLVAVK